MNYIYIFVDLVLHWYTFEQYYSFKLLLKEHNQIVSYITHNADAVTYS